MSKIKFIGTSDENFENGKVYQLLKFEDERHFTAWISNKNKKIVFIPYSSITTFNANWEVVSNFYNINLKEEINAKPVIQNSAWQYFKDKKAIEIVKKFNKENRYRDCGRINNAIDTVIRMAEEQNKQIVDKKYISKNKINDLIEMYEKEINKTGILVRLNQFDLLRAVINHLEDILED